MQVTWSLVAGGAEIYALTIASGLSALGHHGLLCALDKGGALEPEIARLGLPCFVMHRRDPGIDLKLMWRMYRLFRRQRVDVVQTHHFNQLFYSALGARLAGARLIHTEHSIESYKRPLLRVVLRLLARLCDKVIAIGDDGARVLREEVRIPERKLEIIRSGVDPDAFVASRSESRQALGLADDDQVAVIIARLYPEKNHRLLLAAFAEVARQNGSARLLIAGDGTEREAIAAEIERLGLSACVRMLGVRRDVACLLAAADLFVLASEREGLPIAVLEAMAAARPVIATAVGDLPAVVSDGVTGKLVPPGDRAALAAALSELLAAPARAARMGAQARRVVKENYSLGAMLARYLNIYDRQR